MSKLKLSVNFQEGKKEGPYQQFYQNGKVAAKISFKDDKCIIDGAN